VVRQLFGHFDACQLSALTSFSLFFFSSLCSFVDLSLFFIIEVDANDLVGIKS
jgi:hypothetical protein